MTAATRSSRFIRHRRRSIRSPHRPDRKHFLFLPVGAGVPTARTWACINFPTIRRAGCPQPAACQPRNPSGRAHGPCPTKRPVGRDLCVPPPITAAFPATCHCEPVTDVTGVAIRIPLRCASGGSLSFCGERKGGKNAAKTHGFEILSAAEAPSDRCAVSRGKLIIKELL